MVGSVVHNIIISHVYRQEFVVEEKQRAKQICVRLRFFPLSCILL